LRGVPEEPHGVPDEDVVGHHQWGGQPHKVLARGEVHPMDPFQGKNQINKVMYIYIYIFVDVDAIFVVQPYDFVSIDVSVFQRSVILHSVFQSSVSESC
jgi:hypothetical protein